MSFDVAAQAYGRFMGRYSEPLAGELADRELRDTAGDVTARLRLGDGRARTREDLLTRRPLFRDGP